MLKYHELRESRNLQISDDVILMIPTSLDFQVESVENNFQQGEAQPITVGSAVQWWIDLNQIEQLTGSPSAISNISEDSIDMSGSRTFIFESDMETNNIDEDLDNTINLSQERKDDCSEECSYSSSSPEVVHFVPETCLPHVAVECHNDNQTVIINNLNNCTNVLIHDGNTANSDETSPTPIITTTHTLRVSSPTRRRTLTSHLTTLPSNDLNARNITTIQKWSEDIENLLTGEEISRTISTTQVHPIISSNVYDSRPSLNNIFPSANIRETSTNINSYYDNDLSEDSIVRNSLSPTSNTLISLLEDVDDDMSLLEDVDDRPLLEDVDDRPLLEDVDDRPNTIPPVGTASNQEGIINYKESQVSQYVPKLVTSRDQSTYSAISSNSIDINNTPNGSTSSVGVSAPPHHSGPSFIPSVSLSLHSSVPEISLTRLMHAPENLLSNITLHPKQGEDKTKNKLVSGSNSPLDSPHTTANIAVEISQSMAFSAPNPASSTIESHIPLFRTPLLHLSQIPKTSLTSQNSSESITARLQSQSTKAISNGNNVHSDQTKTQDTSIPEFEGDSKYQPVSVSVPSPPRIAIADKDTSVIENSVPDFLSYSSPRLYLPTRISQIASRNDFPTISYHEFIPPLTHNSNSKYKSEEDESVLVAFKETYDKRSMSSEPPLKIDSSQIFSSNKVPQSMTTKAPGGTETISSQISPPLVSSSLHPREQTIFYDAKPSFEDNALISTSIPNGEHERLALESDGEVNPIPSLLPSIDSNKPTVPIGTSPLGVHTNNQDVDGIHHAKHRDTGDTGIRELLTHSPDTSTPHSPRDNKYWYPKFDLPIPASYNDQSFEEEKSMDQKKLFGVFTNNSTPIVGPRESRTTRHANRVINSPKASYVPPLFYQTNIVEPIIPPIKASNFINLKSEIKSSQLRYTPPRTVGAVERKSQPKKETPDIATYSNKQSSMNSLISASRGHKPLFSGTKEIVKWKFDYVKEPGSSSSVTSNSSIPKVAMLNTSSVSAINYLPANASFNTSMSSLQYAEANNKTYTAVGNHNYKPHVDHSYQKHTTSMTFRQTESSRMNAKLSDDTRSTGFGDDVNGFGRSKYTQSIDPSEVGMRDSAMALSQLWVVEKEIRNVADDMTKRYDHALMPPRARNNRVDDTLEELEKSIQGLLQTTEKIIISPENTLRRYNPLISD